MITFLVFFCVLVGEARAQVSPPSVQERYFLENRGQLRYSDGSSASDVLYYCTGGDLDVFVLRDRISYVVKKHQPVVDVDASGEPVRRVRVIRERVDVQLEGVELMSFGIERAGSAMMHIYHGGEQHGDNSFRAIRSLRARDVAPGVDFVLKVEDNRVKYDIDVKEKISPRRFALRYSGSKGLEVRRDGRLEARTSLGAIVDDAPVSFSRAKAGNAALGTVPTRWRVDGTSAVLELSGWRGEPVLIDPAIYFATYFGDTTSTAQPSEISDMEIDPTENLIVVGTTYGSTRFIRTAGMPDTLIESTEAFVSKFSKSGVLIWSTMYGGAGSDEGLGLATDRQGFIYICGSTSSDSIPRPVGTTVYRTTRNIIPGNPTSQSDAFLARLQPSGRLLWGTFFGATSTDVANDVAVVYTPGNPQPVVAITGRTFAGNSGKLEPFDTDPTPGSRLGSAEAYIAVFSQTGGFLGTRLFCGSLYDSGTKIYGDPDGNFLMVGETNSTNIEIAGANPLQSNKATNTTESDIFIARIRQNWNLLYSTYYGGSGNDIPSGLALDSLGGYIIVGQTQSKNFPLLNAFQNSPASTSFSDAFVLKMSRTNSREFSTYIAGDSTDIAVSVAAMKDSTFWVGGHTASPNFPITFRNIQGAVKYPPPWNDLRERTDIFIMHFDRQGDTLFSAVYGDTISEQGSAVAVWSNGNIAVGAEAGLNNLLVKGDNTYRATGISSSPYIFFYGCDISTNITPADDQQLCAGQSVVLNAGAGFAGYRWSNGATTQTITVSTSGSYSVTVRDGTGCEFTSAARRVTINPLPPAEITIAEGTRFLCGTGSKLTLYGPVGGDTYRWGRVNMSTVVGNDDTLVVQDGGRYILEVKSAAGCASYDTVIIERRLPANVSIVGSTTVDFGSLDGCENTKEETFSLRNGSGEAVEVMSVVFDNPQFQCVSPLPLTIAGNGTQAIRVRFSPTGSGAVQSSMTITADPCGTVVTGEARGERTQASVSYSPSEMSFGESWLCSTVERDTAVVVRNTGGESLRLSGGAVPAFASIATNFPVDIASGDSAEVVIRYRAVSAGASQGDVAIYYESGVCRDTLRTRVSISGADGVLSSAAGSVSFAPLVGCVTSSSSSFTLVNNTSYEIEVVSYTFGAGAGSAFSIPSPVGSVGRGVSADVGIVFTPAGAGISTDILRVVYRIGECEKELSLDLRGELRGVDFAVSTPGGNDTLAFGTVITCSGPQVLQSTLRLENRSAEGIAGTWEITGVGGNFSVVGATSGDLPSEENLDIVLEFTGGVAGTYGQVATVRFEPCGIEREIVLTGLVAQPETFVSATALDFTSIKPGESSTATVSVVNSGDVAVEVPASALECLRAPFSVASTVPALPATLLPGQQLQITLNFAPTTTGTFFDSLCVVLSLPCDFRTSVELLGRAQDDAVDPEQFSFAEVAAPLNRTATPDERDFSYPIYLARAERLASRAITGFRAVVEFDASSFNPTGVSRGTSTVSLSGRTRRVEIAVPLSAIPGTGDTLVSIRGDVLLGSTRITPVRVTSFEWQGVTGDTVETRAGSLSLTEICEEGGERLLDPFAGAVGIVSVSPNPSSGPVQVTLSRYIRSGALLQVVDLSGREIYRRSFPMEQHPGDEVTTVERVRIEGISTGVYLFRLESAGEYSVREVSIVR